MLQSTKNQIILTGGGARGIAYTCITWLADIHEWRIHASDFFARWSRWRGHEEKRNDTAQTLLRNQCLEMGERLDHAKQALDNVGDRCYRARRVNVAEQYENW